MKDRCYDKKVKDYKYYGERGITICDEWLNSVDAFCKWGMATGYEKGLQIDRIDNDKGYSPDNCRWVTPAVNCRKRNTTRLSPAKLELIKQYRKAGMTQQHIANILHVHRKTVGAFLNGITWKEYQV